MCFGVPRLRLYHTAPTRYSKAVDRVPGLRLGYLRFTRAGPHPAATVAAGARAPARGRAAHIVIDGGTDREWREPAHRTRATRARSSVERYTACTGNRTTGVSGALSLRQPRIHSPPHCSTVPPSTIMGATASCHAPRRRPDHAYTARVPYIQKEASARRQVRRAQAQGRCPSERIHN